MPFDAGCVVVVVDFCVKPTVSSFPLFMAGSAVFVGWVVGFSF